MGKELEQIKKLVGDYYADHFAGEEFVPGQTPVLHSGKVFDAREMQLMVEAVLDGWWTEGHLTKDFESRLASLIGVAHCVAVNSGSSANLLAAVALTSPLLGKRRLRPGDEVITVAAGFPTTVNPIFQIGCRPVFVDVELDTLGPSRQALEAAVSSKTKAIMVAHPLGNPVNLDAITDLCRKHDLWFVEDACDALGSTYRGRQVGSFGDLATVSFFPAHHITMGEGGVVLTDDAVLEKAVISIRDWGRDYDSVSPGFDRSYTYSHPGYNLKTTDLQAACGLVQLDKLADFGSRRRANFNKLRDRLDHLSDYFRFMEPSEHSQPSWFGFSLMLRENCPFSREALISHLSDRKIASRLLFAGNITRQPYFVNYDIAHKVVGELTNTDLIMDNLLWIGCYPGIGDRQIDYMVAVLDEFVAQNVKQSRQVDVAESHH